MKNISPGLPLFLFNYSDRKLYGIFEAVSPGQMSIDPYGWTTDVQQFTPYPAQVWNYLQLLLGLISVLYRSHFEWIFLTLCASIQGSSPNPNAMPTLA